MTEFSLSFNGNSADDHELDFYDAAQAMLGFQRSLAITTHLILNGKVITQAPSLKNARIISRPPEEGSWTVTAIVAGIAAGGYKLGTIDKNTPLGHLIYSAYDYIVSETLGFNVDYDKSLGQQYEQLKKQKQNSVPLLEPSQFDSAIEKCEYAIREMHRPIIKSGTATSAKLNFRVGSTQVPFRGPLDSKTFEYISQTKRLEMPEGIRGFVSSYNMNTFKGRIFIQEEKRPIPFELAAEAQTRSGIKKITESLGLNAVDRFEESAEIEIRAFKNVSKTERLKSLYIVQVF